MLDASLVAAARALLCGDPLVALNATAGREEPHALALRGIALAQLAEYRRARELLQRAAAAFAARGDVLHRARAVVAEAEVAAVERDLGSVLDTLKEAIGELRACGDRINAAWGELVAARLMVLSGETADARDAIARAEDDAREAPAFVRAVVQLARAEAALREVRGALARRALDEALAWAERSQSDVLLREVARARHGLSVPVARARCGGRDEEVTIERLETLCAPAIMGAERAVVVDALRRRVLVDGAPASSLATRPMLLALLVSLARVAPEARGADVLAKEVFGARAPNESHRARLRVELGRLRRLLPDALRVVTERSGWALRPGGAASLILVSPARDEPEEPLRALLSDGAAWPVRSIVRALGSSARTVQRGLSTLCERGEIRPIGQGRARKWAKVDAPSEIASQLLLLGLSSDR